MSRKITSREPVGRSVNRGHLLGTMNMCKAFQRFPSRFQFETKVGPTSSPRCSHRSHFSISFPLRRSRGRLESMPAHIGRDPGYTVDNMQADWWLCANHRATLRTLTEDRNQCIQQLSTHAVVYYPPCLPGVNYLDSRGCTACSATQKSMANKAGGEGDISLCRGRHDSRLAAAHNTCADSGSLAGMDVKSRRFATRVFLGRAGCKAADPSRCRDPRCGNGRGVMIRGLAALPWHGTGRNHEEHAATALHSHVRGVRPGCLSCK